VADGFSDAFSARYGDLLYGSYDCVDRIVLNAYHTLCYQPGGFRTWWRRLHGDDEQLDNAHLMRMAGRFARRVKAWGAAIVGRVTFNAHILETGTKSYRLRTSKTATRAKRANQTRWGQNSCRPWGQIT